ncbi:MAG: BMP family lipoprotein [Actinomycetota bacterium]
MRKALKVVALLAVVALVAAACGGGEPTTPGGGGGTAGPAKKVGLVYDIGGRGDKSFNDAAARGLDQAKAEFNIEVRELEPSAGGENREELLRLLAQQGFELNIGVGFLFATSICKAGLANPNVKFADVDGFIDHTTQGCDGAQDLTESSNVSSLLFAEEQGSYLVGAAAALKSTTGKLGFIGGVEVDLIKKFEAGFAAGAKKINPSVTIDVKYITQPPDFTGFNDPAKGKEIATGMYQGGADVVYHAAGGSGSGLFEAAKEHSTTSGSQMWAIGVDSDQYQTAPADQQPYILTSMLKRVEVAVYETIKDFVNDQFKGGYRTFDLQADGVGYSTSGGFVDDIASQLEDLKKQIIDGTITVPTA